MNRTIAICSIICWLALWAALIAAAPWTLSDKNTFFKGFVNEQFLSFMGVIVTITLASASNLYLELNKMEDRVEHASFHNTKRHVRHSAYILVADLLSSIILVVIKPLADPGDRTGAFVNGLCLSILLIAVLVLIDLVQAAFNLDPRA